MKNLLKLRYFKSGIVLTIEYCYVIVGIVSSDSKSSAHQLTPI